MPYKIVYSPEATDHVEGLTARERSIVVSGIDKQLLHQPTVETRNRKLMRSNDLSVWELRLGALRVYYDVLETEQTVLIRAVGVKRGNRIFIAGKEMTL